MATNLMILNSYLLAKVSVAEVSHTLRWHGQSGGFCVAGVLIFCVLSWVFKMISGKKIPHSLARELMVERWQEMRRGAFHESDKLMIMFNLLTVELCSVWTGWIWQIYVVDLTEAFLSHTPSSTHQHTVCIIHYTTNCFSCQHLKLKIIC